MIEQFCTIRDYLISTIEEKINVFLTYSWDPFIKHSLIKETTDIVHNELTCKFPDFPVDLLPKCRFRINDPNLSVEVAIQNFFNPESELIFLGTAILGDEILDCYFRKSYDPNFNYVFISRYGHGNDDYYLGSKTAEAEYYLGQYTPLSVAYAIAYEDGFIG